MKSPLNLPFKIKLHWLLSGMEEKPAKKTYWLKDYTAVAVLGILFILLFWWFTSTFNTP